MCILRMHCAQCTVKQAGCALPSTKNRARMLLAQYAVALSAGRAVPNGSSARRATPKWQLGPCERGLLSGAACSFHMLPAPKNWSQLVNPIAQCLTQGSILPVCSVEIDLREHAGKPVRSEPAGWLCLQLQSGQGAAFLKHAASKLFAPRDKNSPELIAPLKDTIPKTDDRVW